MKADKFKPAHLAGKIEPENIKQKEDYKAEVIPDRWYDYGPGEVNPNKSILESAEVIARGSKRFFLHPMWSLMSEKEFAISELLSFIRELPPRLIDLLVVGQDPVTAEVILNPIYEWVFIGEIQEYDSYDSLSALMACYLLTDTLMKQRKSNKKYPETKKQYLLRKKRFSKAILQLVTLHSIDFPFYPNSDDFFEFTRRKFFPQIESLSDKYKTPYADKYINILQALNYLRSDTIDLENFIHKNTKKILMYMLNHRFYSCVLESNEILAYKLYGDRETPPRFDLLARNLHNLYYKNKIYFIYDEVGDLSLNDSNIKDFEITDFYLKN